MKRYRLSSAPAWLLLVCILLLPVGCRQRLDHSATLDRVEEARLAAADPNNYGRAVRIRGVVTYCDPEWHLLFLQDQSGGLFIDFGGEEFLIVIPNCDVATANEISERIRVGVMNERFATTLCARTFHVTGSFGVAMANVAPWDWTPHLLPLTALCTPPKIPVGTEYSMRNSLPWTLRRNLL